MDMLKIALVSGLIVASIAVPSSFEKLPFLKASDVVPEALRKGSHHEIAERVETDGLWNTYTVKSALGDFTVHGSYLLRQRIHELYALAELRKINEAEVALMGAEASMLDTAEILAQMGMNPMETAEGVVPGIRRMFDKINSKVGAGLKNIGSGDGKKSGGEPAILKMAEEASGVTETERKWAKRFGVDPYTLNGPLRAELRKLAIIETGGRLSTSTFVPVPTAVSVTARVGHIVWDSDPDELKQKNRDILESFEVPEDHIEAFQDNSYFGLTRQTAFINYLVNLGNVRGRGDFITRAAMADSEALAVYFLETARLLKQYHDMGEMIIEIMTNSNTVLPAIRTHDRILYILPIDYFVWTEFASGEVKEATKNLNSLYPSASLEMWITGAASESARAELAALDVSLREGVFPTRLAPLTRMHEPQPSKEIQSEDTVRFGGKYADLAPEQHELIDLWFEEFNRITGEDRDPQSYYDLVPLSARTTFEAVTHALIKTPLTTSDGRLLGNAIDLIKMLEAVRGRIPKTRGDMQFRIYVVLNPGAVDMLEESIEFSRHHDNTVYHKDYPINYRLDKTPSIQFSVTRNMERADIDVDYRSSRFPMVLFDGHLTAGNSDVRAGNNHERHVGRWAGFGSWWRNLFGLLLPTQTPERFESKTDIPPVPRITDDETIEVAVHDFLKTWLVDGKPEQSVPYFSPTAYDCLLELHGKRGGTDDTLARYRLLHEMQLTNHLLGKPKELKEVIRPVYSTNRELVITPHRFSRYFAYYELPNEVVDQYTCPAPEGYRPVALSEEGGNHIGAFSEIMGPHGESEELVTVWKKESGYWKIVSIHLGPDIHHANLPDHRLQSTDSVSPTHRDTDPDVPITVENFLTALFVRRDYSMAEGFFSNHCHDCTNTMIEDQEPNRTPAEAARHIRTSLQQIAEAVPKSSDLEDILIGIEPWHPDVYVVDHPDRGAYLLASVPDSIAERLACKVRTPHAGIHAELPPHGKDLYMSAFSLKSGLEDPPILFLLWAKESSRWKVVSYHVEMH